MNADHRVNAIKSKGLEVSNELIWHKSHAKVLCEIAIIIGNETWHALGSNSFNNYIQADVNYSNFAVCCEHCNFSSEMVSWLAFCILAYP
jgi:hypothetical protein